MHYPSLSTVEFDAPFMVQADGIITPVDIPIPELYNDLQADFDIENCTPNEYYLVSGDNWVALKGYAENGNVFSNNEPYLGETIENRELEQTVLSDVGGIYVMCSVFEDPEVDFDEHYAVGWCVLKYVRN